MKLFQAFALPTLLTTLALSACNLPGSDVKSAETKDISPSGGGATSNQPSSSGNPPAPLGGQQTLAPISGKAESCGVGVAINGTSDFSFSSLLQSDGKFIVLGETFAVPGSGNGRDASLVRFHGNGAVDFRFGDNGRVVLNFAPGFSSAAYSAAQQADGKIIVAGTSGDLAHGDTFLALARLNIDGSLDKTFGGKGTGSMMDAAMLSGQKVLIQPDGKILVGGYSTFNVVPVLVRYNADGSPDLTFGGNGYVVETGIISPDVSQFWSIEGQGIDQGLALQSDGKIVLAAQIAEVKRNQTGNSFNLVFRYTANGQRDVTFNGTGLVQYPMSYYGGTGVDVRVQPDGKIVTLFPDIDHIPEYAVIELRRYNPNGILDQGFGSGGQVVTEIQVDCWAQSEPMALALQIDGKIVVAGSSLWRYNPDGSVDRSFAINGQFYLISNCYATSFNLMAHGLAITAQGQLLFTGVYGPLVWDNNLNYFYEYTLYYAAGRLNADGSVDTTFGQRGRAEDRFVPDAKRVFVTDAAFTGALGGIAGANALCQQAADDADLGGRWVAYLSTTAGRAPLADASPWYLLDRNTLVFPTFNSLGTVGGYGGAQVPLNMSDQFETVNATVWTGSLVWGGIGRADNNISCDGWTSGDATNTGILGDASSNINWSFYYNNSPTRYKDVVANCAATEHLYCFEQ